MVFADWINLTGAETAPNIAEIKIGDGGIDIALEVFIDDTSVMLPDDVLALLRQWWCERRCRLDSNVPPAERYLFPGRGSRNHLTTRQYGRLFQHTVSAAGIRKPVTLHTLRHYFATHLLERGVDIRKIQALLGHDKLETTARYARVATGMIAEIESPLEGLKPERRQRNKKT